MLMGLSLSQWGGALLSSVVANAIARPGQMAGIDPGTAGRALRWSSPPLVEPVETPARRALGCAALSGPRRPLVRPSAGRACRDPRDRWSSPPLVEPVE